MVNKRLFSSAPRGQTAPPADTINLAGGRAYKMDDKHALAQAAATGCFSDTFYLGAEQQLSDVLGLCAKNEPSFVAKCAVYARMYGYMKDMPSFMAAYLAKADVGLLRKIFPLVIDNPKMLRNFVQVVRSGTVGRKSLGSAPKKLVQEWIHKRTPEQMFRGSVGNDPSMSDVIKMVHPYPDSPQREALYGYLIGKEVKEELLPKLIQDYEAFKKAPEEVDMPSVPFQMVTALPLTKKAWKRIAERMSWTELRMNLNTLERHEVLKDKAMVKMIAEKLRDRAAIQKSKAFPYQIMTSYMYYEGEHLIKEALQDAMDIAVENVPVLEGNVVVAVDISGSMASAVTGLRKGATSKMRCVDVAALFSACILKKNPAARVLPFHGQVIDVRMNPRDSIMTNAEKLARMCNNGTDVSAPMRMLVQEKWKTDTIIYFSDNESWMDRWASVSYGIFGIGNHRGTSTQELYNQLKARNPKMKMVCVDLTPNRTLQAKNSSDVLNMGGFSDTIFDIINEFVNGKFGKDFWTKSIEQIDLNSVDKFSA